MKNFVNVINFFNKIPIFNKLKEKIKFYCFEKRVIF